jgi:predicted CXXCH cytochrome family protein
MRTLLSTLTALLATGIAGVAFGQGQSVIDSPHNLSTFGPSIIRATTQEQVCIFCHTPHNASPIRPLWNRFMPVDAYVVYSSNSLDARPGQPTGSSKMCLSCHDGTIALGSIVSQNQIIQMAQGITTLPPGSTNLGTDLSDDHPISFRYDSSLVFKDPKLVDPHQLPPQLRLDHNRELQCTTCHDPHDDSRGYFLVMSNENSALCRSCHQISATTVTEHADCTSCHRTHTAPSGPYLLTRDRITSTCLTCHSGNHGRAKNILQDLNKISVHDTNSPVDPSDPIPSHATCSDCHDQHTVMQGGASAPDIHPNFGQIDGLSASGSPITLANNEYEVCFKCHADKNAFTASWVPRRITQLNTRLEFDVRAVSFHPVEGPGRNMDVPSLKPPWTTSSVMHCSDCHGSDSSRKAGGSGPNGVHGSNEPPLLMARYETADFTTESASAYALCYRCHYRDTNNGVLLDRSFPHSLHVRDNATACSTCHDAHGISSAQGTRRNNSHLINFDTSIVFPERATGRLEFVDRGSFSGNCTLTCHGVDHSPKRY